MNEIIKSLFDRHSTRVFTEEKVDDETKQLLINSAIQAPSAGNQIMYNIIDVTSQDLKEELVKTCDNQPFIAKAPLVFVFVADLHRWQRSFELSNANPRKFGAGDLMLAFADACIAAQNMVVAAESLGLGSCYIGDILENCEKQRELLNLPNHCMPACMLVIGYPTKEQKERVKPNRIDSKYVVGENAYPELSDEDLKECYYKQKSSDNKTLVKPFEDFMQAFCNRKYNSEFSREMTRSTLEYWKDFAEN